MADPAQTPGPQRAITDATPVRVPLGTFVAIIGSIIIATFAAALWANDLQRDVADLGKRLERIEAALGVRTPLRQDVP